VNPRCLNFRAPTNASRRALELPPFQYLKTLPWRFTIGHERG
jgi:hypothetical protein